MFLYKRQQKKSESISENTHFEITQLFSLLSSEMFCNFGITGLETVGKCSKAVESVTVCLHVSSELG